MRKKRNKTNKNLKKNTHKKQQKTKNQQRTHTDTQRKKKENNDIGMDKDHKITKQSVGFFTQKNMKCYQNTYLLTYDNDYNTIRNEILTQQLLADITYSRNIVKSNTFYFKLMSILRDSRWRPRWPPFHDFRIVCPILIYLMNKVYIF